MKKDEKEQFELDLNFNMDLDVFSDIEIDQEINMRVFNAPKVRRPENFVKSKNAVDMATRITLEKDCRIYAIIDGNFVFFDLVFEIIKKYRCKLNKLSISTLSLSDDNINALSILIEDGYVNKLDLIVSDYFYSHEKHNLVKYIYEQLDQNDDVFQFASASTHCKIITFITENGTKFVIHGSANLRSSSNLEQILIEQSDAVYDFFTEMHDNIIDTYKTIDKSVRRTKLWNAIQ